MKNVAILNTCISGSTGKIAKGLFEKLRQTGYNVFFCYGREDGTKEKGYYKIGGDINKYLHAAIAKFGGLQGYGSINPTHKLIKFFIEKNIDVVYIVSPHGYYINEKMLYEYLKANSIITIYIMIDEYAYLGSCGYSNDCTNYRRGCKNCPREKRLLLARITGGASRVYERKENFYKDNESIIFVGPKYTIAQAKKSPLLSSKRFVELDEAIDVVFYAPRDTSALKEELGISKEQIVCVCVAPYSYERKGCKYYVELARRFENDNRYAFVHVGFNVDPSKENLPQNYKAIGFLKDQNKLADYYSLGDLFVFPSLLDTMPNACLEALSAGTPLLCFDTSGMPYIADETVASFVEPKNVDAMEAVVRHTGKKTEVTIKLCREYALKRYDNREYYKKLIHIAEQCQEDTK